MKQEEIIELIQKGKVEKAFVKLYQLFPKVRSILKNYGASKEQCTDIFQDGLVVLYQKLQRSDFAVEVSIEAYLTNTCKFMYLKLQQTKKNTVEPIDLEADELDIEQILQENKKVELAEVAFQQLGEKCKEILMSFYIAKKSMVQIARQFSFSSENVAKTQKYKCLEAARNNYNHLINS